MAVLILNLICGAALAISGSLTFWPVSHWYDFYIPIVLFIAGYLAGIVIAWTFIDLYGRFHFSKKKGYHGRPVKFARFLMTQGIWYIDRVAMIRLKVRGASKVPQKQRFLMVCNHRSKFDSMLITERFGMKDLAFITKESNMKIPLGGRLMIGLRYLPVDRNDKLQSLDQMKTASELISSDYSSVVVFPEGTRQQDKVIGDFHEGTFNIAIHSKAPIVVLTTKGTDDVHKHWPRFSKCRLDVVCTIPYEEYQGMTAKAISDMVHKMMEEHLQEIEL